jgi:hypothetical protein
MEELQLWVDTTKKNTVYGWTEDERKSFTLEVDSEKLFNNLINYQSIS